MGLAAEFRWKIIVPQWVAIVSLMCLEFLADEQSEGLVPILSPPGNSARARAAWFSPFIPGGGVVQMFTGALSDRIGCKHLVAAAMLVEAQQ